MLCHDKTASITSCASGERATGCSCGVLSAEKAAGAHCTWDDAELDAASSRSLSSALLMMTARRQAPDSARVTRSGATRAREPRGGLAAAARGIATKAASALRAVRTGLGRGARCVAPPSRAPSPAEEAPDWPAGQAAQAGAEQAPSGVLLRLLPPPALLAAALQPFEFHGMLCAMTSPEEGLYIKPSDASTATSVLDLCAAWLRVPAETITVRGARRTLSAAAPQRTIAEAGLPRQLPGSPPAVALRVTAVPWCCICLQPVRRGRVWSCDAAQHSCCHACARQFAETSAMLRPSLALSWLRCPAPGCTASLAHGAALHKLLSYKAMDRLRAQRAAGQAKRLNSVRAGKEDAGLVAMLRSGDVKACPTCSALIEKDGGCNHVSCSVCGAFFDWSCV